MPPMISEAYCEKQANSSSSFGPLSGGLFLANGTGGYDDENTERQ